MNQPMKPKPKKRRQSKGGKQISLDTASLAFAILIAGSSNEQLERIARLALRGPDLIKFVMAALLTHLGANADVLMQGQPTTPASKEELIELTKPILQEGARLASFAQLFDLYLLNRQPTAESVVYVFYMIIRYIVSQEQEPSKEQSKIIWEFTLYIARASKIGEKHWRDLESRGQPYLEDWLDEVKESARKKFKTFRNQKKRMEGNADKTFKSLFNFLFDKNDESGEDPA